jgi:hypothetical protein
MAAGEKGYFLQSAGNYYGDKERDAGIMTTEHNRFYAITSRLKTHVSNDEKKLIFQYTVKNTQDLDCHGGYAKLLPADYDADEF